MSGISFKKGSKEFEMFHDFWRIYQDYYTPEDDDGYWRAVISACENFYKKYDMEFAKKLSLTFLDDLDKRYREMKK